MSRTDKTRPISIRMLDAKDNKIGVREIHNHLKGFCDLPARDPKAVEKQHNEIMQSEEKTFGTSCYYSFSYKGSSYCGCKMCTGQDWRKEERRAKRHNAKTSLKKHTKEVNSRLMLIEEVEAMKDNDFTVTAVDELAETLNEDMAYLYPEPEKVPSVSW